MFRSMKREKSPTTIPDDVSDLINEIESTAAPFDESTLVDREKHVAQEGDKQDSPIASLVASAVLQEEVAQLKNDSSVEELSIEGLVEEELQQQDSPDLLMQAWQASDLSTSTHDFEELDLFLKNIHDEDEGVASTTEPASNVDHKSLDGIVEIGTSEKVSSKATKDVSKSLDDEILRQMATPPAVIDTHVALSTTGQVNTSNETTLQEDEDFNPFVNIGNRLMDSEEAFPKSENKSKARKLVKAAGNMAMGALTLLAKLLLRLLSFGARHWKVVIPVLGAAAVIPWIPLGQEEAVAVQDSNVVAEFNASILGDQIELPLTLPHDQVFNKVEVYIESTPEGQEPSPIHDFLTAFKLVTYFMMAGLCLLHMKSKRGTIEYTDNPYAKMSLKELKEELRSRGLAISGSHSHVVDRLLDDDRGHRVIPDELVNYDFVAVAKQMSFKELAEKLRSRRLVSYGTKDDLIIKVWVPARRQELSLIKRDDLRVMLKTHKLGVGGTKDELIRRLIEAGH